MEFLRHKKLPRKYWRDPEVISDFSYTLWKLSNDKHYEKGLDAWGSPYASFLDKERLMRSGEVGYEFIEQTRWLTKTSLWIRRKLYGIGIYL